MKKINLKHKKVRKNKIFKRDFSTTPSFKQNKKEHTTMDYSIKEGIVKPSDLQAGKHPPSRQKRETNEGGRER